MSSMHSLCFIFYRFGCNGNNYVLRVPLKTKLFFACPSTDYRFFNDDGRYNYENMYFLGEDKAAFDSCNATSKLIVCLRYLCQINILSLLNASNKLVSFVTILMLFVIKKTHFQHSGLMSDWFVALNTKQAI